jgi:protein-S-isoprenylcysteine O-methyltransferase Ste14
MLHSRNARCGDFLFRWRSFLPILFVPFFFLSFNKIHYLLDSHAAQHFWAAFCLLLSISGLFVRGLTIGFVSDGTSGRNTKQQRATELNTTGMYSICRNPLYFGNLLIWVGILSYTRSAALVTIFVLAFWLYYERIIAREEVFLLGKFKRAYRDWCHRTPVFVPNPLIWIKPSRDWSTRMVLRREYTTVLAIGVVFFVMDTTAHYLIENAFYVDASWTTFAVICAIQYLVLRSLKKLTTVLNIPE